MSQRFDKWNLRKQRNRSISELVFIKVNVETANAWFYCNPDVYITMQIIHGYDYIRSQKIGGENPLIYIFWLI